MSASWNLYSFAPDRLASIFGGTDKAHADTLCEVLTDESNFDFEDPELAERVARRVVDSGLTYDGADFDEADVLDCIPFAVIRVDSPLSRSIRAKPISPSGIPFNLIGELLSATDKTSSPLLSLFDGGRRYDKTPTEYCEYIVFDPHEVSSLLNEIQRIMHDEHQWSYADIDDLVDNELVQPFGDALQAGCGVAAFCP